MATGREILVRFGFDVDLTDIGKFDKAIDGAVQRARGFNTTMASVGKGMSTFGSRMSLFVTAPVVGAGIALFDLAADAEETASKFKTVFASVQGAADTASRNLVDNFGLASDQAQQLLGDTGDLLTGFNFTGKQALDLSEGVQQLAVDLASFTNFEGGALGASKALTKALLGERESVKALGIAILDEDVKARVKQLEAAGRFTDETERQKKAIATLTIAQDQSKNAIGDFARTMDGTANQRRLMVRDLREIAIELGTQLIPIGRRFIATIREWTKEFRDLSPERKQQIIDFALMAAAAGPVIFVIGKMISVFAALGKATVFVSTATLAIKAMGNAALIAQLKMFAIVLGVIAVIAIIGLLIEDIFVFATGGESAIGKVIDKIKELGAEFFGVASTEIAAGIEVITGLFAGLRDNAVLSFTLLKNDVLAIWQSIIDGGAMAVDSVVSFFSDLPNRIAAFVQNSAVGGLLDQLGIDVSGGGASVTQPMPQAATISGPGGISTQTSNTNRTTEVNTRIELTVPAGTPDSQMDFIERAAKSAFDNQFDRRIRATASDAR